MNKTAIIVLLAVSVFGLSSTKAASLLIQNHSFEAPVTGNGTFIASDSSAPSGWSIYGPTAVGFRFFGVLNPSGTTLYDHPIPNYDENANKNVGVVFLYTPGVAEGGLEQTLSATLELNTEYTLTVEAGNIANDVNEPHNAFNFSGFPGYRIELLAGGTVLGTGNNTLSIAEGTFGTSTVVFSTGISHPNAGQALGIRLINLNGSGIEVNFDNVRLEAVAVPEPSTWNLVLGATLLTMALAKRRK